MLIMVKWESFDAALQRHQSKSHAKNMCWWCSQTIEAKKLMLVMLKWGSFDAALQKHQSKSHAKNMSWWCSQKMEEKRLMLVMLKWGSFNAALQKHQSKSQARTWVDGVQDEARSNEMMDQEHKIQTWAMNSWFGMHCSWETKHSRIWS